MKTSRLAVTANLCGATHPCASVSTRPAPAGRSLSHLAAILCLALIGQTATAASVDLVWNPNPETDIAGYKLSYGTSPGTYSNTISTGTATTTTVSGLNEGQTYYFVVKAVNTAGLESAPSTEIAHLVPLPPNTAPVAANQSVNTNEDQAVAIRLAASDAQGDALSYRLVTGPSMGTLSGTAPNLTYTPAADVNGGDSFTFVVNDGKADSSTATVSINIAAVNDAPVAAAQRVSTLEDKAVGILLSASDKDGDALSYRLVSGPAMGTLSGTAPNLIYTPRADVNGSDSFSFLVSDGKTSSNTATVSISITTVNDAPVAAAQMVAATAGSPVSLVLSASDKEGDPLSFIIISAPMMGKLSGTPPNLTYTPNATASGSDSFTFRASDGKASSNIATVSISITAAVKPDNKAPVFQADFITRADGKTNETYTAESLAGSAVDPDSDAVSYSKAAGPDWLTVSPDGKISGTPPAGAEGLNSFTIRAADPGGAFDEAVLEITILATELPLPWSLGRIGTVSEQAAAWGEVSALKIKSSGSLSGSTDDALFIWQILSGDGEIIAKISTLENASSLSLIGLEIRESLAQNSKHVFIGTDGNGSLRFIRRSKNGSSTSLSNVGTGMPPNLWLRLVRSGSTVSAFSSVDGSGWKRIGRTTVSPSGSSYIGMMVCGGGDNLSTGVFEDVTVKP